MHICHLTPYYTPAYAFGGVTRAVEGMTRALARRGHQVTVLTTDAFGHKQRVERPYDEMIDGVRVVRMPNVSVWLRGNLNLSSPRGMREAAQSLLADVDVLHCHEFRSVENLLVTPVAAEMGIPLVLSPHGTLVQSTGRSRLKALWDRLLSPAVARRFDHVIALTEQELVEIRALWPRLGRRRIPTAFSVIPNGIDPDDYNHLPDPTKFRQEYGLGEGPVALFMGRLHRRKGVDVLVEAFQRANIPNAKLLIVGPDEGMLDRLRAMQTQDIILTGYLDGEKRLAALASGDVFALPAIGEGLSMAALEAMGCGMAVILSPGCNLPEVADYGAGVIVEPETGALAAALHELLTDSAKRKRMGQAARQLVAERFTWDGAAARLEAVYMGLIHTGMGNRSEV